MGSAKGSEKAADDDGRSVMSKASGRNQSHSEGREIFEEMNASLEEYFKGNSTQNGDEQGIINSLMQGQKQNGMEEEDEEGGEKQAEGKKNQPAANLEDIEEKPEAEREAEAEGDRTMMGETDKKSPESAESENHEKSV